MKFIKEFKKEFIVVYNEKPGNSLKGTQIMHNLPALVLRVPVTEQRYSSDTTAKKGNVPLEEKMAIRSKNRQRGRTTEMLFTELKLKLASTVRNNKKSLKKTLIAKGRPEIALVSYLMRTVTSQTGT